MSLDQFFPKASKKSSLPLSLPSLKKEEDPHSKKLNQEENIYIKKLKQEIADQNFLADKYSQLAALFQRDFWLLVEGINRKLNQTELLKFMTLLPTFEHKFENEQDLFCLEEEYNETIAEMQTIKKEGEK